MHITVISFGFQNGTFCGALTVDVRYLANPYWIPGLRYSTGLQKACQEAVFRDGQAGRLVENALGLATDMIRGLLLKESPVEVLEIGFGCTGGQHRSVSVVEIFASHLVESAAVAGRPDVSVSIVHRDRALWVVS